MAEYINREEALTWFKAYLHTGEDSIPTDTVLSALRYGIPKTDVAPVRHGRWVEMVECIRDTHTDEYYEETYYDCDVCEYAVDSKTPFCPNCGARMDLGGADNGKT